MLLIDDPSMKEIVIGFCDESDELIEQLESLLEEVEDDLSKKENLEKFGQIIDRIMGASKSIGANEIATLSELGKTIGYKASQVSDETLLEIVVAILFDSLVIMKKLLKELRLGNSKNFSQLNTQAFVTRLQWLSEKFKDIERSSCAVDDSTLSQNSIDDLLKSLGL